MFAGRSFGLIAVLAPILSGQNATQSETGGAADVAIQGYYLGGNSQPPLALSGTNISFREYLPSLGLITGNLEGYFDSAHARRGENFVAFHGLRRPGLRWTLTGGDFRFRTSLAPSLFTNYSYPEIAVLGVKVELAAGNRRFTLFQGEETLQEGPRITFRVRAPQTVLGGAVEQAFGKRVRVSVRYLELSSTESQIAANPAFFPPGSEFRRTDSLSLQTSYNPGRGLSLSTDTSISRVRSSPGAPYPRAGVLSGIVGARWQSKKIAVAANYGNLMPTALPVVGYYFGDRKGPFVEIRYKPFPRLEFFGSALTLRNNLAENPSLVTFSTKDVTAGVSASLPWRFDASGQYSKIGLVGQLASDPSQNQVQHNVQWQLALSRQIASHRFALTARDIDLTALSYSQKQRSVELEDTLRLSRFLLGGAVRMQQQSGSGQLLNSLFMRISGQIRLRSVSVYGQYETGNDLIDKTLFAANTVKTTVAGVSTTLRQGWKLQMDIFRTTLLSTLNPANILLLQTQGTGVADILDDFNQWSLFIRLSHHVLWGSSPPLETPSPTTDRDGSGSIEGFVREDSAGTNRIAGVSVLLDQARTAVTDTAGHYRFEDVSEGGHTIALNMVELSAEFSSGKPENLSVAVKPRAVTRADLQVVRAGFTIRGLVSGLTAEDKAELRLESVIIDLSPLDRYTTCDASGEFALYNLPSGTYRVSLEPASLPDDYVLISPREVITNPGDSDKSPSVAFRIEKQVKKLPVRKVLDSVLK